MSVADKLDACLRSLDRLEREVRRIHPEHASPVLMSELQQQYVEVIRATADLLEAVGPALEQHERLRR